MAKIDNKTSKSDETNRNDSPRNDSPAEEFTPQQASTKQEKPDGPREIYALERDEMDYAERRDLAEEDLDKQLHQDRGAGITNRPLDQEKKEQELVPPRGVRKSGSV
jgi:hypothetical protein